MKSKFRLDLIYFYLFPIPGTILKDKKLSRVQKSPVTRGPEAAALRAEVSHGAGAPREAPSPPFSVREAFFPRGSSRLRFVPRTSAPSCRSAVVSRRRVVPNVPRAVAVASQRVSRPADCPTSRNAARNGVPERSRSYRRRPGGTKDLAGAARLPGSSASKRGS